MYKPTKRSKGESLTVGSNKFGDHITGDHRPTRDVNEQSIDGDRVAMVMKDVATNFSWIYPSARGHAKDCVLEFRHFVAPGHEVGVFYCDSAPSIKLACREVGWRQNTSVAYVSKSNAVAERTLRSVLEGTRVNLASSWTPSFLLELCLTALVYGSQHPKSPRNQIPLGTSFWGKVQGTQHSVWGSY